MTLNCKNAYICQDTNSHALYQMRKQCNREYQTPEIALQRSVHSITWENTFLQSLCTCWIASARARAETVFGHLNRPFPSFLVPLFQNESKCETFHFHANQSHFHKNGFALRLALKQRHMGTRKWPIVDHGGVMATWLGRSTPERVFWVPALARIALSPWEIQYTLTVPLFTHRRI